MRIAICTRHWSRLWLAMLCCLPLASRAQTVHTAQAASLAAPRASNPTATRVVDFVVPETWTRNYPTTEYVLSARSNQRMRPQGVYTFVPAFVGLRRTPLVRTNFRLESEVTVLKRVYDDARPAQLPIQLAQTEIHVYRLEAKETHLARHYLVMLVRKNHVYQADIMIPHFSEEVIRQLEADAAAALSSLQLPN